MIAGSTVINDVGNVMNPLRKYIIAGHIITAQSIHDIIIHF
jgi:hypothetical protein